jgi:hypothetical protein
MSVSLQSAPLSTLRRSRLAFATWLLPLVLSSAASGEEDAPPSQLDKSTKAAEAKPWLVGVAKKRQDAAEQLFNEGNEHFLVPDFVRAAQKYRDALALWDHPAIHYNLALSLINLDSPIEAYRHLQAALKYGGAPLDAKRQQEAQTHLRATVRQLASLQISSREPGTTVTLDGKATPTPSDRLLLTAGEHHVVATKAGYLPREYHLALFPNKAETLQTRLYTEEQLIATTQRPTPLWLPLTVTSTGALMVLTGAILNFRADTLQKRYDSEVTGKCSSPDGCSATDTQLHWRDDADKLSTWATVSYVAGATTLAGGAIWMWFNRSKTQRLTPEERDRQTTVTPVVGQNTLGAVAVGRF